MLFTFPFFPHYPPRPHCSLLPLFSPHHYSHPYLCFFFIICRTLPREKYFFLSSLLWLTISSPHTCLTPFITSSARLRGKGFVWLPWLMRVPSGECFEVGYSVTGRSKTSRCLSRQWRRAPRTTRLWRSTGRGRTSSTSTTETSSRWSASPSRTTVLLSSFIPSTGTKTSNSEYQ